MINDCNVTDLIPILTNKSKALTPDDIVDLHALVDLLQDPKEQKFAIHGILEIIDQKPVAVMSQDSVDVMSPGPVGLDVMSQESLSLGQESVDVMRQDPVGVMRQESLSLGQNSVDVMSQESLDVMSPKHGNFGLQCNNVPNNCIDYTDCFDYAEVSRLFSCRPYCH